MRHPEPGEFVYDGARYLVRNHGEHLTVLCVVYNFDGSKSERVLHPGLPGWRGLPDRVRDFAERETNTRPVTPLSD
jgi:hypothetical protein